MFIRFFSAFSLLCLLSSCQTNIRANDVKVDVINTDIKGFHESKLFNTSAIDGTKVSTNLSWGGGGAFTHFTSTNDGLFLTSDVSGVWHKDDLQSQWSPLNAGLSEYEITAMEVSSAGTIYLLSNKYLYTLSPDKYWQRISPPIQSRRNSVSTSIAIHSREATESVCIISRNNLMYCNIQQSHEWIKLSFASDQKLSSVAFSEDGNALLVGLGNYLYWLDIASQTMRKVASFDAPTQMIQATGAVFKIATTKGLYELSANNQLKKLYSINKGIIKRFVCSEDLDKCVLGLERNWSASLQTLEKKDDLWHSNKNKPEFRFDMSLPFRQWRKNLSRTLSLVSADAELQHLYLSDYWGAFYSKDGGKVWHEDVGGAVNTVGTDLLLKNDDIYVSTMDNGVVAFSQQKSGFRSIFPTNDSKLAGHAWQLAANDDSLFFTLSPWNTKKNYVGMYNFDNDSTTLINAGLPNSKKSKQAFWAESYIRGIAASATALSVIGDGDNAGLYSLDLTVEPDSTPFFPIGNWRGQQKIYNAIAMDEKQLQIASCNGTITAIRMNNNLPDAEAMVTTRTNFCSFNMLTHGDITYLLGEKSKQATIVKLHNGRSTTLLKTHYGSAFKALAINPNHPNEFFAATISWSEKANSGAFFSRDSGSTWHDVSCVLSHHNGVVSAKFSDDAEQLYILHKVGGLITVPSDTIGKINC